MKPEGPRIDFPREGEIIRSGTYTIRLGAPQEDWLVEISINGGVWLPCRAAAGYWWYDWSGIEPGAHEIEGRLTDEDGITELCAPRRFLAEP